MAADDEYYQEEIDRRNTQIEKLQDDLDCTRGRIDDTQSRRQTLKKGISDRESGVQSKKQLTAELEGRADQLKASSEDVVRKLEADAQANAQDLQELESRLRAVQDSHRSALAVAERERQRVAQLDVDVGSSRGRLSALQRDTEKLSQELQRDEAAHAELQERQAELLREDAAKRREEAEQLLSAAAKEATSGRVEVDILEKTYATEKEASEGLGSALSSAEKRGEALKSECRALEEAVRRVEGQASSKDLAKRVADARSERGRLRMEMTNVDQESLTRTQILQGALEETRLMLSDSQEVLGPEDPGLQVLRDALLKSKEEVEVREAALKTVEEQCMRLQAEMFRLGEAEALQRNQQVSLQAEALEQDLQGAQRSFDDAERRRDAARRSALAAQAEVAKARSEAEEKEAALRRRLEELWALLRRQVYELGDSA